jgi:phage terminase large subunit
VFKRWGFDTGEIPPDTFILKTTYLDNHLLSPAYLARMENMKKTNPTRWKIEALGDFVTLDKLIFQNYTVEDFDYEKVKGQLLVGMDFGFIADPTAIIASLLDEENKKIYIFKEWSGKGKTN